MDKIGSYRLIPSGASVWSIANQSQIIVSEDTIVEVAHTCHGNDGVFVKPMQLLFNMPGQIPTLIGRGKDEWSLSYSATLPYTKPEPKFFNPTYSPD